MPVITSDELNYLVYRYLLESGHEHSAYVFSGEAHTPTKAIPVEDVPVGALAMLLQKGMQYLDLEAHLTPEGTLRECSCEYTLFGAHTNCDATREDGAAPVKRRPRALVQERPRQPEAVEPAPKRPLKRVSRDKPREPAVPRTWAISRYSPDVNPVADGPQSAPGPKDFHVIGIRELVGTVNKSVYAVLNQRADGMFLSASSGETNVLRAPVSKRDCRQECTDFDVHPHEPCMALITRSGIVRELRSRGHVEYMKLLDLRIPLADGASLLTVSYSSDGKVMYLAGDSRVRTNKADNGLVPPSDRATTGHIYVLFRQKTREDSASPLLVSISMRGMGIVQNIISAPNHNDTFIVSGIGVGTPAGQTGPPAVSENDQNSAPVVRVVRGVPKSPSSNTLADQSSIPLYMQTTVFAHNHVHSTQINRIGFSTDGNAFYLADESGIVSLWELLPGKELTAEEKKNGLGSNHRAPYQASSRLLGVVRSNGNPNGVPASAVKVVPAPPQFPEYRYLVIFGCGLYDGDRPGVGWIYVDAVAPVSPPEGVRPEDHPTRAVLRSVGSGFRKRDGDSDALMVQSPHDDWIKEIALTENGFVVIDRAGTFTVWQSNNGSFRCTGMHKTGKSCVSANINGETGIIIIADPECQLYRYNISDAAPPESVE